jgi:hypothetical protein
MSCEDWLSAIEQVEAGPSSGDIEGAPMIDNWFLVWRDGDAIRADGDVSGHPEISNPWVTTSPVLGFQYDFDLEAGWLRTMSRWYRLGRLRAVGLPLSGGPVSILVHDGFPCQGGCLRRG